MTGALGRPASATSGRRPANHPSAADLPRHDAHPGFYSNDLLDNLGHPSATTILPNLPNLDVGGWVPMSPTSPPSERTAFKVHSFDVNTSLLWSKPDGTWA